MRTAKDSNQSVHPHSLIRVFVFHLKKTLDPSIPIKRLARLISMDVHLAQSLHIHTKLYLLLYFYFYESQGEINKHVQHKIANVFNLLFYTYVLIAHMSQFF